MTVFIDILLKLSKVKLVAIFKFAIVLALFLNSIIGEVDILIFAIVELILKSGSPKIPFLEKEYLLVLVYKDPNSYVEFSVVD